MDSSRKRPVPSGGLDSSRNRPASDLPEAKQMYMPLNLWHVNFCRGALTSRFIEGNEDEDAETVMKMNEFTKEMFKFARENPEGYMFGPRKLARMTCKTCGTKNPEARLLCLGVMTWGGERLYCLACATRAPPQEPPLTVDDLNKIDPNYESDEELVYGHLNTSRGQVNQPQSNDEKK